MAKGLARRRAVVCVGGALFALFASFGHEAQRLMASGGMGTIGLRHALLTAAILFIPASLILALMLRGGGQCPHLIPNEDGGGLRDGARGVGQCPHPVPNVEGGGRSDCARGRGCTRDGGPGVLARLFGQPFSTKRAFAIILLCFAPMFIIAFPGSFTYDVPYQLKQVFTGAYSTHHPLLHTLVLGACVALGKLVGHVNLGAALYTALQCAAMALCFALTCASIARQAGDRAARRAAVFFALYPLNMVFAVNATKDAPFAALFALSLALACEMVSGLCPRPVPSGPCPRPVPSGLCPHPVPKGDGAGRNCGARGRGLCPTPVPKGDGAGWNCGARGRGLCPRPVPSGLCPHPVPNEDGVGLERGARGREFVCGEKRSDCARGRGSACSRRACVRLCVCTALMLLLRNNALYAAAAWVLVLLLFLKGRARVLAGMAALSIALAVAANGALSLATQAQNGNLSEMLSWPIQQLARARLTRGNALTDEEREAVDELMPGEAWRLYMPGISDPVKFEFDTQALLSDPARYARVYLSIGAKCPHEYFDAIVLHTYAFFYPYSEYQVPVSYASMTVYGANAGAYDGWWEGEPIRSAFPRLLAALMWRVGAKGAMQFPVVGWLLNMGVIVWVMLFFLLREAYAGRWARFAAASLCVLLWGTYLLGPVMMGRYIYPFACALPVLASKPSAPCGRNSEA